MNISGNTVVVGGFFTPGHAENGRGLLDNVATVMQEFRFGTGKKVIFSFLEAVKHPEYIAEAAAGGALAVHSAGNIILPELADIIALQSDQKGANPDVLISANGPKRQMGPKLLIEAKLVAGGVVREAQHIGLGIKGPDDAKHWAIAGRTVTELAQHGFGYLGHLGDVSEAETVSHVSRIREAGVWCGMVVAKHDVFFPDSPTDEFSFALRIGNHDTLLTNTEETLGPIATAYALAA